MISISKKFLLLLILVAVISVTAVNSFVSSNQDFEGLFTMDVPTGKHYEDMTYCYKNKALGCAKKFEDPNDDNCVIDEDEIAIYYYDNSLLYGGESSAAQHSVDVLTTSFVYDVYQNEGKLLILKNKVEGMRNLPHYLVGVTNEDGSEAVFVGGYDLDMLKSYANSIKFK